MEAKYMHLLGRCVFRVHKADEGFRYYLSGTDETMVNPWNGYFLAQLPHAVETVDEAIESLKPNAVINAENLGIEVKRQGEWFFIPDTAKLLGASQVMGNGNGLYGLATNLLEHRDSERNRRHLCTQLKIKDGIRYAKGTIRHIEREHKMLKLGNVWHTVHENTEIKSFRAQGRVD